MLAQVVRDQVCTEDELVRVLRIESFEDGDLVYRQGQAGDRDVFFIEQGSVALTKRRPPTAVTAATMPSTNVTRRDETDIQVDSLSELEYFGELTLLQGAATRATSAVAVGSVTCMALPEAAFTSLLGPVHELLLYRHLLREHRVLDKDRLMQRLTQTQRQFTLHRCGLARFASGERICQQDETDDRYFVLCEGEAEVELEEVVESPTSSGESKQTVVVARKTIYQGFGEMGLLDRPRVASVLAVGSVLCVVIPRALYVAAAQEGSPTPTVLDSDATALLATTLIEEWTLAANARNLHLSNPRVAHYLVTFIKKFKAAYSQQFDGRTVYLDLLRRLHLEPGLADEMAFLSHRVTWDSPSSSLSIIRSESRRVLGLDPAARTPSEVAFVTRLIERTALPTKLDRPAHVSVLQAARALARVVTFVSVDQDRPLFRQGRIESRAFLILRGSIQIVNENPSSHTPAAPGSSAAAAAAAAAAPAVRSHEVIATLGAGASFGELSLVARLPRSASAVPACSTDLIAFDRDHLAAVQRALPGVAVQQLMVTRAEFLSRLSCFKGSDFAQCIRVAHDLTARGYEQRQLFLRDPTQHRTLFIVKSGEIGVFVKKMLPQPSPTRTSASNSSSSSSSAEVPGTAPPRMALVRVATIGPQEFFGVAVATANTPSAAGTAASPHTIPVGDDDFATATYMSCSYVETLELPERGWRRLSPECLRLIGSALVARHRWNAETADRQRDAAYYHVDRPWQLVARADVVTECAKSSSTRAPSSPDVAPPAVQPATTTQLARRLDDKQRRVREGNAFTQLFTGGRSSGARRLPAIATSPSAAKEVSDMFYCPSPSSPTALAWGAPGGNSPGSRAVTADSTWSSSGLGGSFFSTPSRALVATEPTGCVGTTRVAVRALPTPGPPPGTSASSPRAAGRRNVRHKSDFPGYLPPDGGRQQPEPDAFQSMWKRDRRTSWR